MWTNIHVLKIREEFAEAVNHGDKTFEIRENDRGFQKGDIVKFLPVDKLGIRVHSYEDFEAKSYRITYVLNGWGLKDGYVAFGIEEVEQ